MLESERELAKLGVPIKTRHNEVAPAQYEVAPMFENSNVGSDHQQLTMQVLQNVARRYGLVCLLHEKPFAGVNGSGKHNNWSMGTDTGDNLLEPGDTPHENLQFLFFCAAVIQAVDNHQACCARRWRTTGQDHRLGANEAPPAIISIFLGAELRRSSTRSRQGEAGESTPESSSGSARRSLPPLPKHGGDRNRTSPFAFTGNKFEFRALGSTMSLSLPNTVLNTIVAQAIDELADALATGSGRRPRSRRPCRGRARTSYANDKRIVFEGDNYSDEWHAEAERARPAEPAHDAGRAAAADRQTRRSRCSSEYEVLSERELQSRYEVFVEQYVIELNIEAETAASIARTMRCRRPSAPGDAAGGGRRARSGPSCRAGRRVRRGPRRARAANAIHHRRGGRARARRSYVRDTVLPAMARVREVADRLEKHRGRRPVAAAEVRGDPVHQVGLRGHR